ncbi:internal head protein [Klebsiella phage vB_KpM_Centimanus]
MKLSYTQRVLGRQNRPALESENTEEVVDQSVIDAQPTEEVPVVEDDLTVVEEGTTDPEETPAEELPVDAGEVAADVVPVEETVVEETPADEVPVDGIEPVEPPQIVPVTDSGEATVDQVEAIAEGNPVEAAEVVAEVDNAEGADTTPEEVIAEAEEIEAVAPSEDDVTPEATEELTEIEEAPVEVSDITPEGTEPTNDETISDVDEVVAENLGEETPETDPVDPAVENCACESAGTNPPNEGGTGQGEQHLPSEQVEVDSGKGEEVKPEQTKPVADEAGNSDIEVSQEKPAAEGKGEAELPSESEVVDEGTGSNQNTGEVVSTENAEVVEEQVVDAPSEVTPEEAAAVVTGAEPGEGEVAADAAVEPVVESLPEEAAVDVVPEVTEDLSVAAPEETAGEAPTEGVVEAVADAPVDLSPETDDGDVVADDLIIEDFQAGTEDEESILEEALDTYPQVAEVLQNSLDNGGVSVEAMQILNIFTKRDGNPLNSDVALESYNFTARTQTRLALESIGEDMKNWIGQAVELVKKGIAKIREFLHERFNQVGILERRAAALKDVDMGIAGGVEITGGFFPAIQVEGKIPSNWTRELGDFTNQYKKIAKFRHAAADASNAVIGMVKTDILDVLVKDGEKSVDVSAVYEKAEQTFKGIVSEGYFKAQNNGGFPSYLSPELIGDVQLEFLFGATGGEGAWHQPTFKVNKLDFEAVTKGPSLNGQQIHSVAMEAAAILSEINTKFFDDSYSAKITSSFDEMIRIGNLSDNSNTGHRQELEAVRKMLIASNRFAIEVIGTSTTLAMRVVKGAIEYAEASAKAKAA